MKEKCVIKKKVFLAEQEERSIKIQLQIQFDKDTTSSLQQCLNPNF